jgi:sec-independent protein translocase protein TatA
MLGPTEWILIALIVIVLFGGKKIPELAKGLGKGIREFKSAKNQIKDEIENTSDSDDK